MKINKDLLLLKAHYFSFNAGTAPLYPTMPVYAKQLGLSSVVVGTIYTIFPICGVLAKPFIGAVGDRYKAHKQLLLACLVLITTSYFAIQFVPGLPQNTPTVNITCGEDTTFQLCPRGARQRGMAAHMVASNASAECRMQCEVPAHVSPDACAICAHHARTSDDRNGLTQSDVKPGRRRASGSKYASSNFTATVPMTMSSKTNFCINLRVGHVNWTHHSLSAPTCREDVALACVANCSLRPLQRLLRDAAAADTDVPSYWQFWVFFMLLFVSWVSTTVAVCLTDTICVEILGRQSRQFGNQRLFGSAGWGLLAVAAGLIVDAYSDGTDFKNYTPAFYLMLVPMIADIIATYFLQYEQTTSTSRHIWKDVGRLFLNARIVVFMIWCTFVGVCFGMIWNFLFWYMEELADLQGGDAQAYIKTIEGLVGGIQCFLGEVPSYFLSGWVLQRIGHGHAMTLVVFLAGVRFLLYSVITDPWWVLPVSVLQGMNGLFFPTMTSYAKVVAEPGTEATVQGLVSALCEGVGVALGSFLGGILVDQYGGAATFRIFGIAAMVMTVFNATAQHLLERYATKETLTEKGEKTKFEVVPA